MPLVLGRFSRENATSNENAKAREKDWTRPVVLSLPLHHWSVGFLDQRHGQLNLRSVYTVISLVSLTLLNPKICNIICLKEMGEVHTQAYQKLKSEFDLQ